MTTQSRTPMPFFGPTVFELLPGARLGTRPADLAKSAAVAISRARRDQDTSRARVLALEAARDAARTTDDVLVSELLTPPLPPTAAPKGPPPT
ncbi:hypothetical protein [Streptomyces sp. H27-C3]|uniref:hypothetical protein n=1 Tax=Streptomyces sp. H27-C3 TaxID=3046305 RepID=UPI0024B9B252|nr:hypothetical protein [Streptomyces sp. H27-C3]MDJ0465266.1 hypothetical protein [Streptomyces sp. H27-C3]